MDNLVMYALTWLFATSVLLDPVGTTGLASPILKQELNTAEIVSLIKNVTIWEAAFGLKILSYIVISIPDMLLTFNSNEDEDQSFYQNVNLLRPRDAYMCR